MRFELKRCLDEAEYAGIFCHSHIIGWVKFEIFLILHDVIALTLVPLAFYATYSAAFYTLSEPTFRVTFVKGAAAMVQRGKKTTFIL